MSDVVFPGRFRELASYYTTGRPTYPRLLARRVAHLVGLDGTQTVVDLGTGPGFLAIDFHPFAGKVIAVDPEPEMLNAARRNATKAGVKIDFVSGSSGDLGPRFGRLHLVTIGRAFHWMDRPRTLQALDGLIEPTGGVALFQESYPQVPDNDWHPAFQAILDHYGAADPARNRTQEIRTTRPCFWILHSVTLNASPCSNVATPASSIWLIARFPTPEHGRAGRVRV